eukprot:TRINITY_DN741_c0_g1_i2.p1 TRINITY_DN741_c0_g1~~TRINITY_DN741_c0_g1_i2.p1  ORF type:complete len:587 (-),score=164.21 TRINITY_DN741_c0_g1_i2:86-1846(-)
MTNVFPPEWLEETYEGDLEKRAVFQFDQPFEFLCPMIEVLLVGAYQMPRRSYFCEITIGQKYGQKFRSRVIKKTTDPIWNESKTLRIENSKNPWLCHITCFHSKKLGGTVPIDSLSIDLKHELGMSKKDDLRRWKFKLDNYGRIEIQFTAKTNFIFPLKCEDMLGISLPLPFSFQPEIELTIYQAINLHGEGKWSDVYVEASLISSYYSKTRIKQLLKTATLSKTWNPYWKQSTKFSFTTALDKVEIVLHSKKPFVLCFSIEDIKLLAKGTETRKWISLHEESFIGIGFRALNDLSPLSEFNYSSEVPTLRAETEEVLPSTPKADDKHFHKATDPHIRSPRTSDILHRNSSSGSKYSPHLIRNPFPNSLEPLHRTDDKPRTESPVKSPRSENSKEGTRRSSCKNLSLLKVPSDATKEPKSKSQRSSTKEESTATKSPEPKSKSQRSSTKEESLKPPTTPTRRSGVKAPNKSSPRLSKSTKKKTTGYENRRRSVDFTIPPYKAVNEESKKQRRRSWNFTEEKASNVKNLKGRDIDLKYAQNLKLNGTNYLDAKRTRSEPPKDTTLKEELGKAEKLQSTPRMSPYKNG